MRAEAYLGPTAAGSLRKELHPQPSKTLSKQTQRASIVRGRPPVTLSDRLHDQRISRCAGGGCDGALDQNPTGFEGGTKCEAQRGRDCHSYHVCLLDPTRDVG